MIRYTPAAQLEIEEFKTPFELKLDADNRWVKLGQVTPSDQLASIYYEHLQADKGLAALNARIAIGAMTIKHKLVLPDREAVATIQENPYMQYFLGLDQFHPEPLFDTSVFVDLRKRMGEDTFDKFNGALIEKAARKPTPKRVKVKDAAGQEDTVDQYSQEGGRA
ncbi:MAG TPA: hypothetical protein DDY13_17760 [Cytophagales bacterium]|jgi:IS5 family transposase|nr:hypothetical protein [Cytophagales bacterium]